MALKFGYIDAIAVDSLYSYEVLQQYSEFEVLEEPIGDDAIVAYVTPTRADLLEELLVHIISRQFLTPHGPGKPRNVM